MTRYSASRDIVYSAPPGPDGSRTGDGETGDSRDEPTDDGSAEADDEPEPAVTDATADD